MNQSIRFHALGFLARREHGRQELIKKLVRKGHDEIEAQTVVAQLASEDMQSDRRFCSGYIASRLARGFGARYCSHALKQRGIDAELVQQSLVALSEDFDMALLALWQRKYNVVATDIAGHQKQLRFLLQRGFEPDSVRALLRDLQQGNK